MVGSQPYLLNITLGWKCLTVENALAYYDMAKITAVKTFIVQAAPAVNVIKTFFLAQIS
jgi:hypothetical protein